MGQWGVSGGGGEALSTSLCEFMKAALGLGLLKGQQVLGSQKCCSHQRGVAGLAPVVLSSRVTAWLEAAKALFLMIIQSSSHSHYLKSALIPQLPCEGPAAKAMSLCVCVQDS